MVVKVLHAAHLPFWSGGVVQQMLWEQQAANTLGMEWQSRVFLASGSTVPDMRDPSHEILVRHVGRSRALDFRRAYYEWLVDTARDVDLLLLRNSPSNPLQLMAIRKMRCEVLLVHHTLEVIELANTPGMSFKARAALESFLGPLTFASVAGGITVTPEIAAYETARARKGRYKTYLYPNGISGAKPMAKREVGGVPRILFVASRFFPWHGLDRLLLAARQSTAEFVVDVVGEVEPGDRAACAQDSRFVLHGSRDRSFIAELTRKAWVGLTSLALDRNGMEQACTLKVREYLGAGLPVYSGHGDVFPDGFAYYERGDGSIESILEFAVRARHFDSATVVSEALPFIDKTQILARLHTALEAQFDTRSPT